jgi:endonuclease/exonuclease/phosphatase family metal-dependent hydrolase
MRLLTMNIWADHGDWPARRDYLTDQITELSPDLLTLQETVRTDTVDQATELFDLDYRLVDSGIRDSDGMGTTIATRYPILDRLELDLQLDQTTQDFPCSAGLVVLDSPLGELVLVNYFPSWKLDLEAAREQQALRLVRAIDDLRLSAETPVIIAGDLDADPSAASIRFLTGRQSLGGRSVCYRDAWESVHPAEVGATYTRDNPLMVEDWPFGRIDYVLVRCGTHGGPLLEITDCRRVFDTPRDGVWASDHFGVLADLTANTTVVPQ